MRTTNAIALLALLAAIAFAQKAAPKYEETRPASEGLQAVSLNGKWGFIDEAGKVIVQPKYVAVGDFSQGMAKVSLTFEKSGLIDKTGKVIMPVKYESWYSNDCPKENPIFCYGDGLAVVNGYTGKFNPMSLEPETQTGLVSKAGIEVISPNLGYNFCAPENGGVMFYRAKDEKTGFVNKAGKVTVQPKYRNVEDIEGACKNKAIIDGHAKAYLGNDKWEVVDINTGIAIVPAAKKYENFRLLGGGFIEGTLGEKRDIINKSGKVIVSGHKYEMPEGGTFPGSSEGLAVKVGGKIGLIDINGKEIVPPKYDQVGKFSDGLASVCLNKKCGFVDKTGKEVVPLKYDETNANGFFSAGSIVAVKLGSKWLFVDKTGKEIEAAPAAAPTAASAAKDAAKKN
jgi:hypothetical protein